MPETVTHNEELGIIEVHSFDVVSKEDISSSANLIKHISKETGIKKVLVDALEIKSMPSATDIFSLYKVFPRNVKIAVLCSKEQPAFKEMVFTETVALTRGVSLRLFISKTDAFQWLSK